MIIVSKKEDYQIIKNLQEGQKKAFANVYERFRNSFYKSLKSNFPNCNDDDIYDVFHDALKVLLERYIKIGKMKAEGGKILIINKEGIQKVFEGTLSGFVYIIGRNILVKKLNIPVKPVSKEELIVILEQEGLDNEEPANLQLVRDALRILKKDSEKCYEILIYKYWQKMSMEEIAEVTDANPGSTRTKKFRCMKKLKQIYFSLLKKDIKTPK